MSSATRTSCELQVLDAAIVEKIEEAVEKVKVIEASKRGASAGLLPPTHLCLPLQVKKSTKKVRVTVKPHLLFRVSISGWGSCSFCICVQAHPSVCLRLQPLEQQQGVVPDLDAEYHLFDRVVNVRESFTVPLGLRGTIIGIKGGEGAGSSEHTHTPHTHTLETTSQVSAYCVCNNSSLGRYTHTHTRVVI